LGLIRNCGIAAISISSARLESDSPKAATVGSVSHSVPWQRSQAFARVQSSQICSDSIGENVAQGADFLI
jgi:hypothetical protein